MFCQRGRVATLVPPNFITIQGAPAESDAEAFEVTGLSQWLGMYSASVAPQQPKCNGGMPFRHLAV
jgi:hypothetical protein